MRSCWSDQGFRGRACRLMCRILYHLIAALARLAVRSGRAKDLEIIVLRHQLAVLNRNVDRPALTDDDRSLLAAVAHALPRPARNGWLVTPTPCCVGIGAASPGTGPTRHADRAPRHRRRNPPAGDRNGHGEPDVGVSAHPRRTRRPRPPSRRVHYLDDPQNERHRTRTAEDVGDLERVPTLPGSGCL